MAFFSIRLTELNDFNPSREEFKVQNRTLASGLLALRIEFPDNENFVPVTKKIPATMAVSKVKLLLQRVVKRRPHEMALFYRYVYVVCDSLPRIKIVKQIIQSQALWGNCNNISVSFAS